MQLSILKKPLFVVVIILSLCAIFVSIPTMTAHAGALEPIISEYGLYSKSDVITKGSVRYDFTKDELFSEKGVEIQSQYTVSASAQEVEFIIPFISAANNVPKFDVKVGGQAVAGSIYYGAPTNNIFGFDNEITELIDNTFSSVIDESIMGTLYTVAPTTDELNVTITIPENSCLIYQTSNHYSSTTQKGEISFTIKNALSRTEYSYYIIGESKGQFSSENEYKEETISCKGYIDKYYKQVQEYLEYSKLPIDFLYAQMNSLINSSLRYDFDTLFFNSITDYRLNTFRFNVQLEEETIITYASQGKIRLNSYYKPYKYEIEHTRTGSYPIDYTVNLNDATPYILESKGMEQGSTENLYCAFSSSKEPINIIDQQQKEYEDTEKRNKIIVTVCGIVGGIAFIVLVISIIQLILTKKRAPKR